MGCHRWLSSNQNQILISHGVITTSQVNLNSHMITKLKSIHCFPRFGLGVVSLGAFGSNVKIFRKNTFSHDHVKIIIKQ